MWEALLIVIVGGLLGVGGTALGQWLQIGARKRELEAEQQRRAWEAKRDAYVRLAQAIHNVEGATGGAGLAGEIQVPTEIAQETTVAAAAVEMYAPADVWQKIDPAVKTAALQANALNPMMTAVAQKGLREIGADSLEGKQALRRQMLSAMRTDLGLA